ncbi:MAG: ParB N-terminal domain-containing protein [Planctomycetia bacterium]|nr:ParB N-terminal domain-containing protein [Planctomycetia bacterium]
MIRHDVHDVCGLWRMHSVERVAELTDDIRKNGVKTPLVVWKNPEERGKLVIVDGQHRAAIAAQLDIDYPFTEFVGSVEEMLAHVTTINVASRQPDAAELERAMTLLNGMLLLCRKAREENKPLETGLRSVKPELLRPKGTMQSKTPRRKKPTVSARTPDASKPGKLGKKLGKS